MTANLLRRNIVRDVALIAVGATVYAIGLNCFEIPNGLAAGGAVGLATISRELLFRNFGVLVPVGMQVLAINAVLLVVVYFRRGLAGATRTVMGIVASTVAIDLLAPVLPVLGEGDLLLCALWGGAVCGAGIGLIFRGGGNTGGSDIVAQLASQRTQLSVGTAAMIADLSVVALSVPVFGVERSLYASITMVLSSKVVDMVLEGFTGQRAACIISERPEAIKLGIYDELNRGVTEIWSRGGYLQIERPMLYVICARSETPLLKAVVAQIDPNAIVAISEVYEAFGQGFQSLAG